MIYIIQKQTKTGIKHYARFDSAPVHFRSYSWQGLQNNATGFRSEERATEVMKTLNTQWPLDEFEVVRYMSNTEYPLKVIV
jgi:hypothetical protein